MMVFDRKRETMPREELEMFQFERLQAMLARLRRGVRRYREQLGDVRLDSLAELHKLPATDPDDLLAAFPYGMFALPLREVIRLQSVVGPDGKQIVLGHTRNDLALWGRLVARQLVAAGVTAHDVIQIRFGDGVFENAWGYMQGAETIGASVIPEDPYHIEYQLTTMRNYRSTVLITSPSNARDLVELLRARSLDPQSLSLRVLLLSRPVTADEREELHAGLFADVHCGFGVSEILDPGLCVECEQGCYHVNEDQFLVEIVDGELLVTTLCREAMPLLRYRTRIGAALDRRKCACGRSGAILEPGARLDKRVIVNEMPLYSAQIASVLEHTQAAGFPFHLEIRERHIVISLEVTEKLFADTMRTMDDIRQEVRAAFFSRLGIRAEVCYLGPSSFRNLADNEAQ